MHRPSNEERSFIPKNRLKKARLGNKRFLLNPSSFTDVVSMNYNALNGANRKYPIPTFAGSSLREISFEAFITENMEGVKKGYLKEFMSHVHKYTSVTLSRYDAILEDWFGIGGLDSTQLQPYGQPRSVTFMWGTMWYKGYISSVETNYTEFDSNLEPIEATVSITMVCSQYFNNN